MSKQPTRGHISVKGPTYWAFKEACQASNLKMGRVLDGLILDLLEDPKALAVETKHFADQRLAKLESYKEKRRAKHVSKQTMSPEEILAGFHHMFSKPKEPFYFEPSPSPTTAYIPVGELEEVDAEIQARVADAKGQGLVKVDPYHVEVSRKKPPAFTPDELAALQAPPEEQAAYRKELEEQGLLEPPAIFMRGTTEEIEEITGPLKGMPVGLFSEEGLRMAKAASKDGPVTPPTHGRRAKATVPSFHEIPSLIDPTFGKK